MIVVNVSGSRETRMLVFILSTIVFLLHNVEPSVANTNNWVRLVRPDPERPFVQIPESWLKYLDTHQDLYGISPALPSYSPPAEETPYEIHPDSDDLFRGIASNGMNEFVPVSATDTPNAISLNSDETETSNYPSSDELPLNYDYAFPAIDPNDSNQFDPALPISMIEETTEAPDILSAYSKSDEESTPTEVSEDENGYVTANFPNKNEGISDSSEIEEIPTTTPETVPIDESQTFSPPFIIEDITPEPLASSTPGLLPTSEIFEVLPSESYPVSNPVTEFEDSTLYTEIVPTLTIDASQLPTRSNDNIETPESTDSWPPTEYLSFATPESSYQVSPTEVLPSLPETYASLYSEPIATYPVSLGDHSTSESPYTSPPFETELFFSPDASPTLPTETVIHHPLPSLTPCQHNQIQPISPWYNPQHFSSNPRKGVPPNSQNVYRPHPPPYPYYQPYYSPYFTPQMPRIPPPFAPPRFNPTPQCCCPPRQYRK